MFINQWKKELFTVPNLLSLFRIGMVPVYVVLYLTAKEPWHYHTAGILLGFSCLTDALDGQIARHWHMITNLGKILDPLADKVTQLAVILCLSIRYASLRPMLVLFIIKELFQLIAGVIHLRRGKMLSGALIAGKVSTAVLFISLIWLVLFPDTSAKTVGYISILDSIVLSISFISYLFAYLGNHGHIQDL